MIRLRKRFLFLSLMPPGIRAFDLHSSHYEDSSPMSALQNPFSLYRPHRGAWKRLDSSGNRYCAVQNLFHNMLACYVILQVAIFAVALCFVTRVHTRGRIYLPSGAAQAAMDYPRITSYVVTLIATIISFLNTILLGRVLQIALIARMSQPLSLQTLRGGLSLVTGQKLFGVRGLKIFWAWIKSLACMRDGRKDIALSDRQYWTWLKYTLMYGILCGPLTSSWTSFLTPTPVELQFDFTGTEADYFAVAEQLQHMLMSRPVAVYPSKSSPLDIYMAATTGMRRGYGLGNVTMFIQAGHGAAGSELGFPNYIPFQRSLYNGSTGGIYTNDVMMGQDAISSIPSEYQGWSGIYTTIQQGLSADVRCRQQMLNVSGVYPYVDLYGSVSLGSSVITPNHTFGADYGIQRWSTITNCSSDSVAYTLDILAVVDLNGSALGDGVLVGSACKYQDFEKATNQSFLVLMQGYEPSYAFITPTICEVSPRITSVNVGFDGTTVNINDTINSEPMDPEGQDAVYIDLISDLIWLMMFDTQSLSGNAMAAGIQTVGNGLDDSLTLDSDFWNFALENYLRGAIELYGTVLRSDLQLWSNAPTTQYQGTIHVQTLGYEYKRSSHLFLIVPLAVVVVLTCAAAVYTSVAQPKKPGDVHLVEDGRAQEIMDGPLSNFGDSEDFDPTNVIHLMMLASRAPLDHAAEENEILQFHLD
ncbi:hypothetical protein EDB19DRAFT_1119983 [Suillus lakei]|nr:hypothetical protein EDB19DRAFT_1119983 [Suillus lakei]